MAREERAHNLKLYNTILNSLSHELRTPIASILGAADNLHFDKGKLSEGDRHELLQSISRSAIRLNMQVENLLNMSRLESGVVKPIADWCDLSELFHQVKREVEEFSAGHKISIGLPENFPLVKLDQGLMSQVLYNLVHNALLYSPAGSRVELQASVQAGTLRIVVQDDGPGFPEAEIPMVFDKFYRLHSKQSGGTGLGLSIVKGFVEAQGGQIRLQNRFPHGACFSIELPAETAA